MTNYTKGKIIKGTVTGVEPYGIFVSVDEEYNGLIHISEMSYGFVNDVNEYVKLGDVIDMQVLSADEERKQLKLSIKNVDYNHKRKTGKRKIVETEHGFRTLAFKLPLWIEESLKKQQNKINSIDK